MANRALRLAESLRTRIANLHLKTEQGRISITVSIGLATPGAGATKPDAVSRT